jgi:hypothetical protein
MSVTCRETYGARVVQCKHALSVPPVTGLITLAA